MIEVKMSKTSSVSLKKLSVKNGNIVDEDGVVKDLNKIVTLAFEDGTDFDFAVKAKTDDATMIDESGDMDEL